MTRRYWVSQAAQEHVFIVRDKGYTQANMGSRDGIDKMNIGDWILYYSPTVYFEQEEPICQNFTGIACVSDDRVYPKSNQYPDIWRRKVEFFHCNPHHPKDFINKVEFLPESENWQDVFLQELFEISRNDFAQIADKIIIAQDHKVLLY